MRTAHPSTTTTTTPRSTRHTHTHTHIHVCSWLCVGGSRAVLCSPGCDGGTKGCTHTYTRTGRVLYSQGFLGSHARLCWYTPTCTVTPKSTRLKGQDDAMSGVRHGMLI